MKTKILGFLTVGLLAVPVAATAAFLETFDSYATGSSLHGQGGWKGWYNNSAFTAYAASGPSLSAPNSVDINGASDLVHEFSGYTSGTWYISAQQYIPSNFSGESFFILLNSYDDTGATNNWSTQIRFNSSLGQVSADNVYPYPTLNLLYDQWVQLLVVVNLDLDTQTFYYNGTELFTGSWTDGISGSGAKNIAAVDLFANSASSIYYDNFCIGSSACGSSEPVPLPAAAWLLLSGLGGLGLLRRRKAH